MRREVTELMDTKDWSTASVCEAYGRRGHKNSIKQHHTIVYPIYVVVSGHNTVRENRVPTQR